MQRVCVIGGKPSGISRTAIGNYSKTRSGDRTAAEDGGRNLEQLIDLAKTTYGDVFESVVSIPGIGEQTHRC